MATSILIAEDDRPLASLVRRVLEKDGFACEVVHRGDDAVHQMRRAPADLVLLDLMLPGLDGFTVCKRIRPWFRGPILMFTARGEDGDQILGLEIGADDYVVKPVQPQVLLARIRALLRRATPTAMPEVRYGPLRICFSERQAYVDDEPLGLTSAEFDCIALLAQHAGRVLDRDFLYRELRGTQYDGIDRSIDLRVSRVRAALRAVHATLDPIRTVHGRGYMFRDRA